MSNNCNENSGVAAGLLGECDIEEIGCVPLVIGQPTFEPTLAQLPFAYDPATNSLWLWQCDQLSWLEIAHPTLCDLNSTNLDAVTNECNDISLPIIYDDVDGECQEAILTTGQLAQIMRRCLDLRTICELDSLTVFQRNAADSVQLAACVDGASVLIPDTSTCDLIQTTHEQMSAAPGGEAFIHVCLWGEEMKLNYVSACDKPLAPVTPDTLLLACNGATEVLINQVDLTPNVCNLPELTQGEVNAATTVELTACVDGASVLIPYIEPATSICDLPTVGFEQMDLVNEGNQQNAFISVCINGLEAKMLYVTACNKPLEALTPATRLLSCNGLTEALIDPADLMTSICDLPTVGFEQMDLANEGNQQNAFISVCINGLEAKMLYVTACNKPLEALTPATRLLSCNGLTEALIDPAELVPNLCNLPALTQAGVDVSTDVELAACADGVNVLVPYIEPVIISGGADTITNMASYTMTSGDMIESRVGPFDTVVMSTDWSFTNPTNQPGILTVEGSGWVLRYYDSSEPLTEARIPARVVFLLGDKTQVDLYDFDDNQVSPPGFLNDTPLTRRDVSVAIAELPATDRYKFWGNWFGPFALTGEQASDVTQSLVQQFELAPGQTVIVSAVNAVGYDNDIPLGSYEKGFMGSTLNFTFTGSNRK